MTKFKIRDVEECMIEIYEVEAETKEEALDKYVNEKEEAEALDKYVNELADSLELLDCWYDPNAEDTIEVVD